MSTDAAILTINAGSSSIKVGIFDGADPERRLARGQVSEVGGESALAFDTGAGWMHETVTARDHAGALNLILDRCRLSLGGRELAGIGHRIVHGGADFRESAVLDTDAMRRLRGLEPLAPLHQPHNLAAVDACRAAFPGAIQIGCFDTAFHAGHPWVHDTYALPRRFYEAGIRRYGFHGLSYAYVSGALGRLAPKLADGRIVIAHLGNGASMCAMAGGTCISSTMGFSVLDGLPMGTRCGQIDPGALLFLLKQGMDADTLAQLLYRESGLKGLSGISSDMRALETSDALEARQAIAYFATRARRELGAMAADLGGLDALVFCGGIGENSALVRREICEGMEWLGIRLDDAANNAPGTVEIGAGKVRVLVIATDEERVIARAVHRALVS